jgi:predicted nucleic acid-binding protein
VILADTNVVSELMRSAPEPQVLGWAAEIPARGLVISVVTVQEIETGLALLPTGRRRRELERAWSEVCASFAGAFVPFDLAEARTTARILATSQRSGRQMTLADAQIGGTCLAHGWTLATRNVRDFEQLPDLQVINPFGD